jgi:hypothetical protein
MVPDIVLDSWTIVVKEWREWCCIRARFGWGALILLIVLVEFCRACSSGRLCAGSLLVPVVWAALPIIAHRRYDHRLHCWRA